MTSVAVVTVGRSDYSYYRPILRQLRATPGMTAHLVVAAAHLVPDWGDTVRAIAQDDEPIAARVQMSLAADTPSAVGVSMGLGTIGFAQALERLAPDWVLLLGDRFEMLAAAVATVPFNVGVAHVAGGEVTAGAVDDVIRHAITKLSHVHFVATAEYRRRVVQMGEGPERVVVSGAPSLDAMLTEPPIPAAELARLVGIRLDPAPLLVTYHPVTRQPGAARAQIDELLAALADAGRPVVFTQPNADAESQVIAERIRAFAAERGDVWLVPNFGPAGYYSMMRYAAAMVGNSSSGIIEAPSLGLPVVNIGARQEGRLRGANVIDVPCERAAIARAIGRATAPAFRDGLQGLENPYGRGDAARTIVETLASLPVDGRLLTKRFYDLPDLPSGAP